MFRVVLVTAPRGVRATKLARGLVTARLAACVNIVPGIISHYRWKSKLQRDAESLLIIKTTKARCSALMRWIETHHPYSVPEIIAIPIVKGSTPYLAWLEEQVR